jgi:hypothetical protein
MRYRKQLEKLERQVAAIKPPERCNHCRDWHWCQKRGTTAAAVLEGRDQESKDRIICPQCGWSPRMFVHVVVNTHAEVAALRAHRQKSV